MTGSTNSRISNLQSGSKNSENTNGKRPNTETVTTATEHDPLETLAPERIRAKSELVADLMVMVRQYVVLSRPKLVIVALWIIHTHCMDVTEQTPYLAVTSPEKQCGKTRLLDLLKMLTADPWKTLLPTEAVIYRKVSKDRPTLLLDEVDAIFNPKLADRYEGIRALLNEGNQRSGKVPRCLGTSNKIEEFSVFCAKVIAGIGSLPDTVADRSIPIRMERRTSEEPVTRLRKRQAEPGAHALRDQVALWAEENQERFRDAEPDMPEELSDRMQDSCEILVAIADELGCGDELRLALVDVLSGERLDDRGSLRLRLLADIKVIFGDGDGEKRIATSTLLNRLNLNEEAPWGNYYGRGLDANDLAALLKQYAITSTTVHLPEIGKKKGYKKEDFHDAWERYL